MVTQKLCELCGSLFIPCSHPEIRRFCSRSCAMKFVLSHEAEPRKSHSQFKKGISPWNKGMKNWRPEYRHSQSTKDKIRVANSGENAPNWKGGRSSIVERLRRSSLFAEWRNKVFQRDAYTCQSCGDRSTAGHRVILHPHHKVPVSVDISLIYAVDNGITLCKPCHQNIHFTGKKAERIV